MEENKMGTAPVNKLLLSMALPLRLSFLTNSLYNFVDSVFVARVSEDALTAISPAGTVQVIVSALSLEKDSMYISVARQAVFPILAALILSRFGKLELIWFSFVFAEVLGLSLAVVLWRKKGKTKG